MFPSQTNPCLISLEFGFRRAWIVEQFFNQWFLLTPKHLKAKNDIEREREEKEKRMEERKREWEKKKGNRMKERERERDRDSACISGCQIHVIECKTSWNMEFTAMKWLLNFRGFCNQSPSWSGVGIKVPKWNIVEYLQLQWIQNSSYKKLATNKRRLEFILWRQAVTLLRRDHHICRIWGAQRLNADQFCY